MKKLGKILLSIIICPFAIVGGLLTAAVTAVGLIIVWPIEVAYDAICDILED